MINIIQDGQEYGKQLSLLKERAEKVVKAAPYIGIGMAAASTTKLRPVVSVASKAIGKTLSGSGKVVKGLLSTPVKQIGLAAAAVHAGTKLQRHLYKTPSGTQVILGSLTGYLPEKDKQLLRRSKFRLTDLVSGHHQTRLLMKIIRPSWFKENEKDVKIS